MMPATRDRDIGAVEQRVYTLEQGFRDVRSDIAGQKAEFAQQITGVKAEFTQQLTGVAQSMRESIGALASKLDERAKPQWQLYVTMAGFLLAFCTSIGTLAYLPITATTARLETEVLKLRESQVPRSEQADRRLALEDRLQRIEVEAKSLSEKTVPRGEHEEKWRGFDRDIANLQRQLDEMKKGFGDTFSLRDALIQMQRRIDTLEQVRRTP